VSREVHVAGVPQLVDGRYLRQRCSWCGCVLIDQDLTLVAVAVVEGEEPGPPATWGVDEYVVIEGPVRYVVAVDPSETGEGAKIPNDCCMRLDPAVTR
jgi:hypothetical protein